MHLRSYVSILCAMLLPSIALAQVASYDSQAELIKACGSALVIDQTSYTNDEMTQLAILTSALSRSSDDTSFKSAFSGLTAYGFFDGSFDGAKKKQSELEQRLNYKFTSETAATYLSRKLSEAGASSFDNCVTQAFSQPGLHLAVEDISVDAVSFKVIYKPITGLTGNLSFRIYSNGKMPPDDTSVPESGVSRQFQISRSNPARDLQLLVQLLNGRSVIGTASTIVPPFVTLNRTVTTSEADSPVSTALCGGYKQWRSITGNTVVLRSTNINTVFDMSTVSAIKLPNQTPKRNEALLNSSMRIRKSIPGLIEGEAYCEVQNFNDFYELSGRVSVTAVTTTLTKVAPADNNVTPLFKLVDPSK